MLLVLSLPLLLSSKLGSFLRVSPHIYKLLMNVDNGLSAHAGSCNEVLMIFMLCCNVAFSFKTLTFT